MGHFPLVENVKGHVPAGEILRQGHGDLIIGAFGYPQPGGIPEDVEASGVQLPVPAHAHCRKADDERQPQQQAQGYGQAICSPPHYCIFR